MPRRVPHFTVLLSVLLSGCTDGGGGPGVDDEAIRIASRFDALADSIAGDGHQPTAEALRHAAELVRLAGGATSVSLTIDGAPREFLAVAEQLDFPVVLCTGTPDSVSPGGGGSAPGGAGESDCVEHGTRAMRTLIAWEPADMSEVIRIVADTGSAPSREDVPDVMTGLPTYAGSDSAVVGGPVLEPGFSGEYMVRDVGSWWASSGSQANSVELAGGACADDRVDFGWAEMSCDAVTLRFEFSMDVEAADWEYRADGSRSQSGASGQHSIALSSTAVRGARLAVLAWTPPEPEPLPNPPPVDTVTTLMLDVSLDAVRDGDGVVIRFRIANPTGEPVTFDFASGQRYDFAAYDAGGTVLWRWSADKAFATGFSSLTLERGEALDVEERWDAAAVGEVVLEATLTSLNLPIVRTVRL